MLQTVKALIFLLVLMAAFAVQARGGFHSFHSSGRGHAWHEDDPPGTPYHFWPHSFYTWHSETNSVATNGMTTNQLTWINDGYSSEGITSFCIIGFVVVGLIINSIISKKNSG